MVVVVIVVVDVVVVGTVELVLLLGVVTVLPTAAGVTVRVEILDVRTKIFTDVMLLAVVDVSVVTLVNLALVAVKFALESFAKKVLRDVTARVVSEPIVSAVTFGLVTSSTS